MQSRMTLGLIVIILIFWSNISFGLLYWDTDYNDLNDSSFDKPDVNCVVSLIYYPDTNYGPNWYPGATIVDPEFIITAYHWELPYPLGAGYNFIGQGLKRIGNRIIEPN